ncbi:hypothetical protein HMI54_011430, partial [Coelomomyces lativittatus]
AQFVQQVGKDDRVRRQFRSRNWLAQICSAKRTLQEFEVVKDEMQFGGDGARQSRDHGQVQGKDDMELRRHRLRAN